MNDFHLSILKKSVDEWNQWRSEHWNIKPDLSGANLRKANLFRANLEEVNLSNADLRGAKLVTINARSANFENSRFDGAHLQGSDFSFCNFKGANLRNTNLMGTIFKRALMADADLTGANCTGAKFIETNLSDAIFYNAKVKGTNFEGSNIQDAELFSDQFKDANIPLEQVGIIEAKKKTGISYAKSFIFTTLLFFLLFGIYMCIFRSENPDAYTTKIRSSIYLTIGSIYETMGGTNQAVRYYEKAEMYNPNNPKIYFLQGSFFRREKDIPKAIVNYKKYLKYVDEEEAILREKGDWYSQERLKKIDEEKLALYEYIKRNGGTIP